MIGAKGRRGSGTMPRARNTPAPTSERPSRPIILKGIAGSHGLAIGPAMSSAFFRSNPEARSWPVVAGNPAPPSTPHS